MSYKILSVLLPWLCLYQLQASPQIQATGPVLLMFKVKGRQACATGEWSVAVHDVLVNYYMWVQSTMKPVHSLCYSMDHNKKRQLATTYDITPLSSGLPTPAP